ncbi:MAG: ATP-binding protein, partial [Bacteroidota bacterium]
GLQKVVEEALEVVPGGEVFAYSTIRIISSLPGSTKDEIFIGTIQKGFFSYDGVKAEKIDLPLPIAKYIGENTLYNSLLLQNNTFAFATYQKGIVFADEDFNIIQVLNTDLGLQDEVVQFLFVDKEQNLWAAFDNGIAQITWPSPYSLYSEELGLRGDIKGMFYQGRNFFSYGSVGFFQMTSPKKEDYRTTFKLKNILVNGTQLYDIIECDGKFLIASAAGVSFCNLDGSPLTKEEAIAYSIAYVSATFLKPSPRDKNLIYVGMGKNIGLFQKGTQGWAYTGQIQGISDYILSIEETALGQLWVTTTFNAYKIQVPDLIQAPNPDSISSKPNRIIPAQIQQYDESKGYPTGTGFVNVLDGGLLFSTQKGFKNYNESTDSFEPNLTLPYSDTSRFIVAPSLQENGDFWFISINEEQAQLNRLKPTFDQNYELSSQDFKHLLSAQPAINKIFADPSDPNIAWIATTGGLIKYNPKIEKNYAFDFPALVRNVIINGDSLIFAGTPTNNQLPALSYAYNSMRFEYAATAYNQSNVTQYQVWLEGFDKDWSEWTAEIRKDYTNLPEGDFVFKVRAKNANGVISQEGTFSFTILPPWYRSWWAYLIYALLIGAGIYALLRWRTRQLKQRTVELESMVKDRTSQIENQKDQLEQQAEKLKELDQAKSRFFTNISHELRTPLTVIRGMSTKITGPEEIKKIIKRNTDNLLNLVNQILDLRKLEAGTLQPDYIQTDVIAHLKYIFESFQSLAEDQNIKLHFLSESTEILMDIDKEKLLRIFSNLISNAIKFTPDGGNVYLTVSQNTSSNTKELTTMIRDTGIGIPEEKILHIFDRFYQVDDSTTRQGEGTGIGLALCKELVKVLKGDISVTSKEGIGSTFKVILPITRKATLEQVEVEDAATDNQFISYPPPLLPTDNNQVQATINNQQATLLIIEDNPDLIVYLETLLDKHYQLLIARDGEEGIEMALEHIPDLILSDVMMPKKDGYEVCSMLKKDVRTSHIPIVLLTAKATVDAKLEGLEKGADAYLSKPFNEKELFVRLEKLAELRRRLQERYQNIPAANSDVSTTEEHPFTQEDAFMKQLKTAVEDHLEDSSFGTTQLCKALGMSRTQLHLKVKALTNKPTSHVIRSIRLHRAKELLEQGELNVSQVIYEVGFNHLSYFSKTFTEEFGINPKDVVKNN